MSKDNTLLKVLESKFVILKKSQDIESKFINDLIKNSIVSSQPIADLPSFIKNVIITGNSVSDRIQLFPNSDLSILEQRKQLPKTRIFYHIEIQDELNAKEKMRQLVNNRMFRFPMLPQSSLINELNIPIRANRWYSKVGVVSLVTPKQNSKMFRKGAPDMKDFSMPEDAIYCVSAEIENNQSVICSFVNQSNDIFSLKKSLALAFKAIANQRKKKKDKSLKNQVVMIKSVSFWPGFENLPSNLFNEYQKEYEFMIHIFSELYLGKGSTVTIVDNFDDLFNQGISTGLNLHQWIIYPWNSESWMYHKSSPIILFNVVFNGGNEEWTALDIVESIYNRNPIPQQSTQKLETFQFNGDERMFLKSGARLAKYDSRIWNWKELPIGYSNLPSLEQYLPVYQKMATDQREWDISDFWAEMIALSKVPSFDNINESLSGLGNFLILTNQEEDIFHPRRFWNQFSIINVNKSNTKTQIYLLPAENQQGAFPLSQSIESQFLKQISTDFDHTNEKWSKVRKQHLHLFHVMWLATLIFAKELHILNIRLNKAEEKKSKGGPIPNIYGAEVLYMIRFLKSTSFKYWMLKNNLLNDQLWIEFAQWDDIPLSFAARGEIVDEMVDDFLITTKSMIFTSRLLNVLLTNVYVAPLQRTYFKSDKTIPSSEYALYTSKEVKAEEYLCTYMGIRVASEFSVKQEIDKTQQTAIICPNYVKTDLLSQSSYTVNLQSFAKELTPDKECVKISTERNIVDDPLLITKLELIQRTIALIFVNRDESKMSQVESAMKKQSEEFFSKLTSTNQSEQVIYQEVFRYFPYLTTNQMKTIYPVLFFDQKQITELNNMLPIRIPYPTELMNAKDIKLWFSPFLANMTFDIWNPYLLGGDHMASVGKFANGAVTKQIKDDILRQMPTAKNKIDDWITVNPNAEFVIYEMKPVQTEDGKVAFSNDYYLKSIHSTSVFLDINIKPRLKTESLLQPIIHGMEIITPSDFMSKIQVQLIKSTKSLKPDEEIIIDYGSEYWINIDTPFGKKNLIDTFDASKSIFSIFNYYYLLSNISRKKVQSDKHITDYLFLSTDLTLGIPDTLGKLNSRVATISIIHDDIPLNSFKPQDIDEFFDKVEQKLILLGKMPQKQPESTSTLSTSKRKLSKFAPKTLGKRLVTIEKASGLQNSEDLDAELGLVIVSESEEKSTESSAKTRKLLIEQTNELAKSLMLNLTKIPESSNNNSDVEKVLEVVEKYLGIPVDNSLKSFDQLWDRLSKDKHLAQKYFPASNIKDWLKRAHFVAFELKIPLPKGISTEKDVNLMDEWLSKIESKLFINVINRGTTFDDMAKRLSSIEIKTRDESADKKFNLILNAIQLTLKDPLAKVGRNLESIEKEKLEDGDVSLSKIKIEYLSSENKILKKYANLIDKFSDSNLNQMLATSSAQQIFYSALKEQMELLIQMNNLIDKTINSTNSLQNKTNESNDFILELKDDHKAFSNIITHVYNTNLSKRVLSVFQVENLSKSEENKVLPPSENQMSDMIIDILSKIQ